jgi:hypothetical protein
MELVIIESILVLMFALALMLMDGREWCGVDEDIMLGCVLLLDYVFLNMAQDVVVKSDI